MDEWRNFTFDQVVVGHRETLTGPLSVTEVEGLALAAGAIDPASRADPVRERLASTAVMMLVAHGRRLGAKPV